MTANTRVLFHLGPNYQQAEDTCAFDIASYRLATCSLMLRFQTLKLLQVGKIYPMERSVHR